METPPELPPTPRPPLGRTFVWTLLAPVASMGLAAAISAASTRNSSGEGLGMVLSMLTLPAMLVCSILCAVWVGQRKGGGMGFLAFLGIQIFYIAVACAGCAVTVGKMDFR